MTLLALWSQVDLDKAEQFTWIYVAYFAQELFCREIC